jgi:hypothetical protein
MRALIVLLVGVVALGAGVLLGYKIDSGDDESSSTQGLPIAVVETRAALQAAAESGDYDALAEHIPESGFEYTFGGPVEGGPIAYWQELERTTDERPLEALAAILKMPYTLSRGFYYWPWAHTVASSDDLSPHERELLAPLGAPNELFPEGSGYFGWRAAIAPDGTWVFFVAGD